MSTSVIKAPTNLNDLIEIDLDEVSNTSGAYSHTTTVNGITPDHKILTFECDNKSIFKKPITISTGDNSITLSCDEVRGTSNVRVSTIMTGDNIPGTSLEYGSLNTRIGNLSDLYTTNKTSIVNAINCNTVRNNFSLNTTFSGNSSTSFLYKVIGSGLVIASLSVDSGTTSDYGTTTATIRTVNSTATNTIRVIAQNVIRYFSSSDVSMVTNAAGPYLASDNDYIQLYCGCTRNGTHKIYGEIIGIGCSLQQIT